MAKKTKYYVVWKGVCPGVYDTWSDCQLQTKGYEGALFKSFETREAAERAWTSSAGQYVGKRVGKTAACPGQLPEDFDWNCVAVDAACSRNPGPMEYRGVYLLTGEEIFHFGPVYGTNNIGEFLAIVHALALMQQKAVSLPVYSDSRNALKWVKEKKCQTKLARTPQTEALFQLIDRAENWLQSHAPAAPLLKWETKQWGEVPADFGRK